MHMSFDANGYNIMENVRGLLCFCAAQLLVNVSYDVKYLCNTTISSEHLLSANSTTREYVFVLPNAKNLSREINSVYSSQQKQLGNNT